MWPSQHYVVFVSQHKHVHSTMKHNRTHYCRGLKCITTPSNTALYQHAHAPLHDLWCARAPVQLGSCCALCTVSVNSIYDWLEEMGRGRHLNGCADYSRWRGRYKWAIKMQRKLFGWGKGHVGIKTSERSSEKPRSSPSWHIYDLGRIFPSKFGFGWFFGITSITSQNNKWRFYADVLRPSLRTTFYLTDSS